MKIFTLSKHDEWLVENHISTEDLERLEKPLKKLLYTANFEVLESKSKTQTRSGLGPIGSIVIGGPQRSLNTVNYTVETYHVKANKKSEAVPEFNAIKQVEFEGNTDIKSEDCINILIQGFYARKPGMKGHPDYSAVNPTFYVPRNLGEIVTALRIEKLDHKTGKLVKFYETEQLEHIMDTIEDQKEPKKDRLDSLFEDY